MLIEYLKDKLRPIALFIIFTLIFAVVFFLYSLPLSAVLYGGLLCLLLTFFIFIYDYLHYCKKHNELCRLKKGIINFVDELPQPQSIFEKDYTQLIYEFDDQFRSMISQNDTAKTEMIDFYTLWVHQIKTPISAMSVLLQENTSEQNTQLLQELFKIERYTELVLGYLRIEDISSDLILCKCNLECIVKQAVKKYAAMFVRKKIKLELCNLDTNVLTDEKWLIFVVEQILSNSLKYTKQGSIKIYSEEDKILVIEDTGIGIASEDIYRVFQKGFTGFNGRMDKKSTGLGLYLCKKILDKLNHKISILSVYGKGTIVKIDLHEVETFIE